MVIFSRELHLSVIDQTIGRPYIRHLLIFPFPDHSRAQDAVEALRTGFLATLHRFPFLAGVIEQPDPQMGRLMVKHPESVDMRLLHETEIFTTSEDLANDAAFDYEALKVQGMPPSRLSKYHFCPFRLRDNPAIGNECAENVMSITLGPIPVMAAQANFIPGGLVLSAYTHHSVLDGTGVKELYEEWSKNVRMQQQHPGTAPPYEEADDLDSSSARQAIDAMISHQQAPHPCPEIATTLEPPSRPLLRPSSSKPPSYSTTILVFPSSKLNNLAKDLTTHLFPKLPPTRPNKITPFVALTTLIWTYTTLARHSTLSAKDCHQVHMGIAVDHRPRVGTSWAARFLGNLALSTRATCPLTHFPIQPSTRTTPSLAPIAHSIHQTLHAISPTWLTTRLHRLSLVPNPSTVIRNLGMENGPDLFITSWTHMGAECEWDIPGAGTSMPLYIRKPEGSGEGVVTVLPRRRDSGEWEVLISLEEGDMRRLEKGLMSDGWVERVIE